LRYHCENYWSVENLKIRSSTDPTQQIDYKDSGMIFYTFSDNVQPEYFRYTIITFYVTFVFAVGSILRTMMVSSTQKIFISQMPKPDPLLMMCECVYIYRLQNKLFE